MPTNKSAQDVTRELKNRLIAKGPAPPAHRKYNYAVIAKRGNQTNKVVKNVRIPQKSGSGGWTDTTDCC